MIWHERPILLPLTALVCGCLLQYLLVVPIPVWLPLLMFAGLVVLLPCRSTVSYRWVLALFWFWVGMAALVPYLDGLRCRAGIEGFDGQQVTVEGVLLSRPVALEEGQRLDLQVEHVFTPKAAYQVDGRLQIFLAHGQGNWLRGDRIRCPARIRIARLLGLPGEFDYPRYLALHGYHATAWVHAADSVVLMRGAAASSPLRNIDRLVQQSQAIIRSTLGDPGVRGVVLALATGTQYEIPSPLQTDYALAGVSHILSVSGFHVGVISFLWVQVVSWLMLRWEWLALRVNVRRVALLSTVPLMLLYLLFTGAAPATARSVLMALAVLLALWSERETDMLDTLLAVGFIMIALQPAILFELSFQLSFLSLWGIIVLTPLLAAPFEHLAQRTWQRAMLLFCSASLAATLATLVPVLTAFQQASFSGVLANILVVPLLGYGATVLATAAVPVTIVMPSLAWLLLKPTGWLVNLSNQLVRWIAGLPVLQLHGLGAVDFAAAVAALSVISFLRSTHLKVGCLLVLLLVPLGWHALARPATTNQLQLTFLSVGQGDALLVTAPDGTVMLVDGGGYLQDNGRDFGGRYLVPALHRFGIKKIDTMVLTHAHPDHLGGLPAVAEQFEVGSFWQGHAGEGPEYRRLLQALQRQRTRMITLKQGDQLQERGGLAVTVLSADEPADSRDGNDASLVLLLRFRKFSALLMGDAGQAIEQRLVEQGRLSAVSVLKVGHHGSRSASSMAFLQTIKPQVAVLSVGAGNRFGLPAADTLARLTQVGSRLYRTDQQGSIQISSDGTNLGVLRYTDENTLVARVRRFVLTGSNGLR